MTPAKQKTGLDLVKIFGLLLVLGGIVWQGGSRLSGVEQQTGHNHEEIVKINDTGCGAAGDVKQQTALAAQEIKALRSDIADIEIAQTAMTVEQVEQGKTLVRIETLLKKGTE